MKKNNKNRKSTKKFIVEDKEGLTVSYDKEELYEKFPRLINEMTEKAKTLKINSINTQTEQNFREEPNKPRYIHPNELYDPGAIDFIRRCTKKEEAINILEYLLKRNEITQEEYIKIKIIISQEGGLKKLINEAGGPKKPGYYIEKYYYKDDKNQKLNSKED